MKSLRNSFLTLLALTLFGGAGAWAQGQLLTTINASSSFTNGTQTFDNIVTVTLDDASYNANNGWYTPGSPHSVEVAPVNGVTVTGYMLYFSATDPIEYEGSSFTVALEGDRVLANDLSTQLGSVGITKIEVYGPAAIELTKAGANQWSLGQTPDYDLELQVEYYEAHALKNIPAGWTVMVNGVDKTSAIDGDSLLITETDSVTLVPTDPRRVKSVTLQNDVSYITVAGLQLIGKDGDSWATIRDNNPDKIDLVSGYVIRHTDGAELKEGEPSASCGYIDSVNSESSNYNAETESNQEYRWCQSN